MYDQQKARRSYQSAVNNAQGKHFEGYIKAACHSYKDRGRAKIEKVSEPFMVTQTHRDGRFTGRFTANADPDFQGTLAGGRSIVFEAKYTSTDRMKRAALTEEQMNALAEHDAMGAAAAVCVGIGDKFYFIPWAAWRDMKQLYGRQYLTQADIEEYRVRFTGAVMFLDYVNVSAASANAQAPEERSGKHGKAKNGEKDGPGHTANGT